MREYDVVVESKEARTFDALSSADTDDETIKRNSVHEQGAFSPYRTQLCGDLHTIVVLPEWSEVPWGEHSSAFLTRPPFFV